MAGNLNFNSLNFSGETSNEDIISHLFMLREQLEYTLSNLDSANFNYKFFDELTVKVQNGLNIEGIVTFKDLAERDSTVINGAVIKTGEVEPSLFKTYSYPVSNGTAGVTNGEILMYYTDESTPPLIAGGLRMDYEGAGTDTEAMFRIFLYTESIVNSKFKVALKLQSAYRASFEAKEQLYIKCKGDVVIESADRNNDVSSIILRSTIINMNGGYSDGATQGAYVRITGDIDLKGTLKINGKEVTV